MEENKEAVLLGNILFALKHIRTFGPHDKDYGICANAAKVCGPKVWSWFTEDNGLCNYYDVLLEWEHWCEGCHTMYPIEEWAVTYHSNKLKWDPETAYGRKRWHLLNHFITYLERLGVESNENFYYGGY
ncbi:MAG: hypothetical protein Unbinned4162contig1001_24 [Prokaryotic dsDNA virus sp.]|nr:MAG: hypothetical protein Unbinned4162contig1001_24 [Prokaryotic dsDNA virus sp.]